MGEVAQVVAVVVGGLAVCVFLWRNEGRYERRRQATWDRARLEARREELRQRETTAIIRELGRQMLGTLRPGETLEPANEEDVTTPTQGGGDWWTDDVEGIDPTDSDPMLQGDEVITGVRSPDPLDDEGDARE
jgi:hypothetical protein